MRVVHLHSSAHTPIPLSVCLSILCPFCISHCPQLGPVRYSGNRSEKKLSPVNKTNRPRKATKATNQTKTAQENYRAVSLTKTDKKILNNTIQRHTNSI
jgi:epoxyqueuosine reductase QueG